MQKSSPESEQLMQQEEDLVCMEMKCLRVKRQEYMPKMGEDTRVRKYEGWKDAVKSVLK